MWTGRILTWNFPKLRLCSGVRSVTPRGGGSADFRFSIATCLHAQTPIRNHQLTSGNQETHPLLRGAADHSSDSCTRRAKSNTMRGHDKGYHAGKSQFALRAHCGRDARGPSKSLDDIQLLLD